MTVGERSLSELRRLCAGAGMVWGVGPFAVRLKTRLRAAVEGVRFLYADFPLLDDDTVVDAELIVRRKTIWPGTITIHVDGELQYDWLNSRLVVPMLEWTMNVCVFQRAHQYFMLHSAVVSRDGQAAIIPGRAGSGKSTLCAALVQRGWRLLSDEVALIRPDDGRIQPVPRPISLKEQSIEIIRRFAPSAKIGRSWDGTAKGTVAHVLPSAESVRRTADTARPTWLVFPSFDAGCGVVVDSLPKERAFIKAADNAFNYSVLGRLGFEMLGSLVDRTACYDFRYGDLERAVEQFERLAVGRN